MRKIKVLHITFNMGIGGTEQVIRQLVTSMDEKLVSHEILCIDGKVGAIGEQLQDLGITVTALNRESGFDVGLIKAIRRQVKQGGFDIVHCHQYTPYLYGFLAGFFTDAKLVFTEHGRFHPDRYRYKAVFINPIIALLTPAIVAISKATKKALHRYEFIPSHKIAVIYNGIVGLTRNQAASAEIRQALGIPDDGFVVGTVSRLDPVKNQQLMIDAFNQFLGKHSDAWLLMVGDGPDREFLENRVKEHNISSRVIFTGFKSVPVDYLAAMDIFLLSSHTEGTSMTLLEAMSLGIPAVVTDVGGNPEIVVNEETGLLTPPGDMQAFTDALCRLRDSVLKQRLSENAKRRFAECFSAVTMSSQYLELYKKLSNSAGMPTDV